MGHVHLHVGNLAEGEAFYHRALGFAKTVWSYPGALFLSAGGYHHHLGINVWSPGPAPGTDDARLLAWELVVPSQDDVLSAARSLRGAGYRVDVTERGLRVADPWGASSTSSRPRIVSDARSERCVQWSFLASQCANSRRSSSRSQCS